jgi:hypothetical protein
MQTNEITAVFFIEIPFFRGKSVLQYHYFFSGRHTMFGVKMPISIKFWHVSGCRYNYNPTPCRGGASLSVLLWHAQGSRERVRADEYGRNSLKRPMKKLSIMLFCLA